MSDGESLPTAEEDDALIDLANERQLIGAILVDEQVFAHVEEEIAADDFVEPWHTVVWKAIAEAAQTGEPVTIKRMVAALGGETGNPVVDGDKTITQWLAGLMAGVSMGEDWRGIARYLRDLAGQRKGQPGYEIDPTQFPPKSEFGAIRWEDLDQAGPELEYIIDDFFTKGDLSVTAGPSKSGKSFLAIHAGMCVALAAIRDKLPADVQARLPDFFGHKVSTPGLVVYQAGEAARGVKRRLRAFRKYFGVPHDAHLPFVLLTKKLDLHHDKTDADKLIAEARAWQTYYDLTLAMIWIDTLATATPGADENSARDMTMVFANCDKIKEATGAHVGLVHHMNAGGSKLRGHTSIYANSDQVILVTKNSATGIRDALLDKQKDDEEGKIIQFRLKSIELGKRADGRPITSCVTVAVEDSDLAQMAEERTAFKPSEREADFLRALFRAIRERGVPLPAGINAPASVVTVAQMADIREFFEELAFPTHDDNDKRHDAKVRQAMSTAGRFMMKTNVIGRDKKYVWHTGRPVKGFKNTLKRAAQKDLPLGAAPDLTADDVAQFLGEDR